MQTFTVLVLIAFLYYAPAIYKRIINNFKLRSIPIVGSSDPLSSYFGAHRAKVYIAEGYNKYRGSVFRIPMMTSWMIIVSRPDKVDEIRRAPDDVLSAIEAAKETFDLGPFLSPAATDEIAHLTRTPLTRNIEATFPDVRDEIMAAFSDYIPVRDEWIEITVYPTIVNIVTRATNRMLVGLPLCRDPDYLKLNKQFAVDLFKATYIYSMVPPFLKPVVKHFTNVFNDIKLEMRQIDPLVKERLEQEARYGKDWAKVQNGILSWLIEISKGKEHTLREIAMSVLFINFAAIHTTTTAVTHSLFNLATCPEYVHSLREEIEAVIEEQGWSKASVVNMTKLDSFIKETMRLAPVSAFSMTRKTMKDFTFSDGTTIPAGNLVSVAAPCIHTDSDNYVNPEVFDGLRFEKMRGKGSESQSKHSLVSLNSDYILFGHGRHACPGRFFAVNEVKAMLAHILLNYDVKMADGGGRPENVWIGVSSLPNAKAKVLFRKRV